MQKWVYFLLTSLITLFLVLTSCQSAAGTGSSEKNIVVTYSVMGSIVKELVREKANVIVSIPDGLDPHEWEPSAKDIEHINKADLIIQNGLGFETGMQKALKAAQDKGVKLFTASDHITIRFIGEGENVEEAHETPEHEVGSPDPHLWTNPQTMKSVVAGLAVELKQSLDLDVSSEAGDLQNRLENLDAELKNILAVVPENRRKLVTGHESMGYFAQHYNFELIGAIIPSISTQAGVSASDLAGLKQLIEKYQVTAIFTELGTSPAVAQVIGEETGVKVVEITPHKLPVDGSYFTLMKNLAQAIAGALQ